MRVTDSVPTGTHYFIALYVSMAAMWLLYATPGLLVTDLFFITVFQSMADILVYISAAFGVLIACYALRRNNLGVILVGTISGVAVVYFLERLAQPYPLVEVITPYVYWHSNSAPWLQIMTGVVAALGALLFIVTFLTLGFRARANHTVFRRSLYLAGGMAFLFFASIAFFIFTTGGFIFALTSSILGIAGLFLMLRGIPYHKELELVEGKSE